MTEKSEQMRFKLTFLAEDYENFVTSTVTIKKTFPFLMKHILGQFKSLSIENHK